MAELVMRLPAITTEMDEGRLLSWMVTVGQAVKEGDPICEFTTDKVDTELESPYTGTITKLLVPEGGSVRVGDAIALIEGDAPNFLGDLDAALGNGDEAEASEAVDADQAAAEADTEADDVDGEAGVVPAPRAVRLEAERRGIDLAFVTPTGSRGQVTLADLDTYEAAALAPADDLDDDQVVIHEETAGDEAAVASEAVEAVTVDDDTAAADDAVDAVETDSEEPAEEAAADMPAISLAQRDESDEGEPSLAAQRPQERRGRRAERTGGRRRGRRRQEAALAEQPSLEQPSLDQPSGEQAATEEPSVETTSADQPVAGVPVVTPVTSADTAAQTPADEPITIDPALTIDAPTPEPAIPAAPTPVVHEVRVESAPPFTLYAQLDVTDLHTGNESGLALLSRLVWAYGQALWEQPEANAMWDHQEQTAVSLDTVYVDLGIETVASTMETVPIAVPKDAPIAQIGLSVTNAYGLVRQGTPPEVHVPQRSATLIDLGPWRVERFTPVIQPPQVTALSVGEIQTVPSLVGRTVTIRQLATIGLTIDTRVLDPVQAASLLATIIDHASRGDGLDQPA